MSYYEILLFLHIAAATVWLGAGLFLQVLVHRAGQQSDEALLGGIAANSGWLAQRIFIPSSLAVLVLGVLLTIEGPWSFGDLWIVLGLVGYGLSFAVGIGFIEPEGKRISAAMTAGDEARAARLVRRINTVSRVELVVLYLVLATMALKPSGDDTATLLIGGAILLAAVAWAASRLRAEPVPA